MTRQFLFPSLLFALLATLPARAESRNWRNADGSRTFAGEYLSHDAKRVSIRSKDGRVFTLDLTKLHSDDRNWLATRSLPAQATHFDPLAEKGAIFDNLKFGDSIDQVTAKLKASRAVQATISETYLARVGLNGSFRTRQKIGGLHCLLFFDWDKSFHLTELTLQTEPRPADAYDTTLQSTWKELVELMTTLHGQPSSAADYPASNQLAQEGMVLGSHLWSIDGGYSALLGTARDHSGYSVIVRFNSDPLTPPPPTKKE